MVLLPVSGGLFYLALRQVGWGYLLGSLREANYWLVGLALAVGLVSHIARAARWRELLLAAGLDASLYEVFYAVMFGYACNLLLPRAGEVARCARLAELKRFPLSETLGSVVSERLSDVVVFLLMTLMAVVVSFHYFGAFLWERIVAPFMARFQGSSLWLGLTLLVGAAALLTGLVWAIKRGIFGARLRQWCGRVARGLGRGMGTIIHLPRRGRFLLYTVLIWVCYWLMTYLVCLAYPATAALPISTSYLLLVVGTFGMMVPGGLWRFPPGYSALARGGGDTKTRGSGLRHPIARCADAAAGSGGCGIDGEGGNAGQKENDAPAERNCILRRHAPSTIVGKCSKRPRRPSGISPQGRKGDTDGMRRKAMG